MGACLLLALCLAASASRAQTLGSNGFYDVAERFYFELVPQAREVLTHVLDDPGNHTSDELTHAQNLLDYIETDILCRSEHSWFNECRNP